MLQSARVTSFTISKLIRENQQRIKEMEKNYMPVKILPNLSKIDERCMETQMNKYFDPIFSKYQFGFRKGYGAQYC